MSWLPDPLHPAIVHFPIALTMVALLLELLARHPRLRHLESGAVALLVLAALGGVAADVTGGWAHDEAVVPTVARALMHDHAQLGDFVMWALIGVAVLRLALARGRLWRGWVPWAFLLVLAVLAGAIGYQGYMGGKLVFDHGVGTELLLEHH
jgi:uncharacterized membrane protein